MKIKSLEEIIAYCTANSRICPQPQLWQALWEKLKDKKQLGSGGWEPALPLILAAWWDTPSALKQDRLIQHMIWADSHEQLGEIVDFLTGLKEDQWVHLKD